MKDIQIWNAQLLYEANLILGEGATWHSDWKKFLYVDIEGQKVGAIDPLSGKIIEKEVFKKVGTAVPANNGKLIVALQGSIDELDFETGELRSLLSLEDDKPNNRCNDGKCDAAGRLWIGTMNVDAKDQEGALYCFDGLLRQKMAKRTVSNGICWSPDNTTMYYIDSFDYNIKAFDFDLPTATINNERVIVTMDTPGFIPDGMTIDAEGMLWVAIWGGGCVHRYNPADGALIGIVLVDAPNVTACAFGGENTRQLFITTAKTGLSKAQLQQSPLSGSLFIVDTGINGIMMNSFDSKKFSPAFHPIDPKA